MERSICVILTSCTGDFFIYQDTQEACNLSCLNPFIPTFFARGEKKKLLGLNWNRTQVFLLQLSTSDRFDH